jgi:fucose permease
MIERTAVRPVGGSATRGVQPAAFVLFGLLGVGMSSLGPLLPVFQRDYHVPQASLALVVTAFFVGALGSTLVTGAIGFRRMGRAGVPVLLGLVSGGLLGLAFLPGWSGKIAAAGSFGLGLGGLTLYINTYFAGLPGHRGFVLVNFANGVFGIGALTGPVLTAPFLPDHYRYLLVALAVALLAGVPVAGLTAALADRAAPPAGRPGMYRVGPHAPVVSLFCVLLLCYGGLEAGASTWAPAYLISGGFDLRTAAALTSLFWAGLAVGRLVVPVLTRGWASSRVVTWCLGVALVGLAGTTVAALAPVGYAVTGMAAGPILPTCLTWIARSIPEPGRVNAIVVAADLLGAAVVPLAIGWAVDASSPAAIPAATTICVLAALAVAGWIRRTRQGLPDEYGGRAMTG